MLLAVVARPAAHGRGAGAKATAAGSHAVARRVLGQWAGGGLPLPQAKAPSTIARQVILFGSGPCCRGSGPFVLRGGGGSRKSAVALPGALPFEESGLGFADTRTYRLRSAEVRIRWRGNRIEVAASMARSFGEVYGCFLPSTLSVLSKKWPCGIRAALL